MSIDVDTKVFYKQYDLDYRVIGNGNTVHLADRFKLNIYFDSVKRGTDIMNLSTEVEMQRQALQDMKDNSYPLDDDTTIKRLYKWFDVDYNPKTRVINSFTLNEIASSHLARRTFIGNLYKKVKDPNLVGSLSGHKEGSKAFARYRDIDEDMKKELVDLLD